MNFIPKMNHHDLLDGYKSIIQNIYSIKPYYKRLRQLLLNYKRIPNRQNQNRLINYYRSYQISFRNRNYK